MTASDPALLGAALFRMPRTALAANDAPAWVVLWAVGFTAVAISAWYDGRFLRLAPQRLMLVLGPPFAILSACALHALAERPPRAAKAYTVIFVGCGLASIAVASLTVQGPIGFRPGKSLYGWAHAEAMNRADARCLEALGSGRVMAPATHPPFGDILALRGDASIFGSGAWDHGDRPSQEITEAARTFFDRETPDAERKRIAFEWCVDWVDCPDRNSLSDEAAARIDA